MNIEKRSNDCGGSAFLAGTHENSLYRRRARRQNANASNRIRAIAGHRDCLAPANLAPYQTLSVALVWAWQGRATFRLCVMAVLTTGHA